MSPSDEIVATDTQPINRRVIMKCNLTECKNDDGCAAISDDGFMCTRILGHLGDHISCCDDEHDLETWENVGYSVNELFCIETAIIDLYGVAALETIKKYAEDFKNALEEDARKNYIRVVK